MPADGQGHILPLTSFYFNTAPVVCTCPCACPPLLFLLSSLQHPLHICTPKGKKDVIWAIGPCSGGRWRRLWRPCTAYLRLVFIQFSFGKKCSQPSSPNLISLPLQTRYRSRTRSQAAERWQDGLGLQRFCSFPTHVALLSPAQVRASGEEVCAAAGTLARGSEQFPYHRQAWSHPRDCPWTQEVTLSVTTPRMSQHSFSPHPPKHLFGTNLQILTKYSKLREGHNTTCVSAWNHRTPALPLWSPHQLMNPGLNQTPSEQEESSESSGVAGNGPDQLQQGGVSAQSQLFAGGSYFLRMGGTSAKSYGNQSREQAAATAGTRWYLGVHTCEQGT